MGSTQVSAADAYRPPMFSVLFTWGSHCGRCVFSRGNDGGLAYVGDFTLPLTLKFIHIIYITTV